MRLRLLLVLLAASALVAPGPGGAYPWPVTPFNKPHPVRANIGDPRTVFELSFFQDGIEGPGSFAFHNGVDIAAPDGTPVYPVVSGTVKLRQSGSEITVDTKGNGTWQYFHVIPLVDDGERVVAKKTVLGHVALTYGHVHLTEIRDFRVRNPLRKGGLTPYRDTTKPRVSSIFMRAHGSHTPLDPLGICGTVSLVAEAYDNPSMRVLGPFAGFPVAPALVTWSLRKVGGTVLQPTVPAFDVRTALPAPREFWDIYARGTYQNAPRFANRQFSLMPGRYLYNLNSSFDTRTVANGVYEVTVRAADIRENASVLSQRFTIVNQRTETGCAPAPAPRLG